MTTTKLKPMAHDTAVLLLCVGDYIHVKVVDCDNPNMLRPILMEREKLIEPMRQHGCVKSASGAAKGGYGLQMLNDGCTGDVVFIQTKENL